MVKATVLPHRLFAPEPQYRPWGGWVIWAIAGLWLGWAWSMPAFPSQDGPSHVSAATTLASLWTGSIPGADAWFQTGYLLNSNWLGHILMAALVLVFDPIVAEKVMVSTYVLATAWVVHRLAKKGHVLHGTAAGTAILVSSLGFFLHMGFYNFCLGSAVMLWLVSLEQERQGPMTADQFRIRALILLLAFTCHPLTAGAGLVVLWSSNLMRAEDREWRRLGRLTVASAIPMALLAGFTLSTVDAPRNWLPLDAALTRFWEQSWNACFRAGLATAIGACLSLTTIVMLLLAMANASRTHLWMLATAGAFAALSVIGPDAAGRGSYVSLRLAFLAMMMLLSWLSVQRVETDAQRVCAGAMGILVLALLGTRVMAADRFREPLHQLLSLELPKGSLVAGLAPEVTATSPIRNAEGESLSSRVNPLKHSHGWLAARARAIDLKSYEAGVGGFPLQYRPARSPYPGLWGRPDEFPQPAPRWGEWAATAGAQMLPEYLVVWEKGQAPPAGYERVSRAGRVSLWQRR